jgi:tetratricopeptide (TPR) repeat protein
VNALPESATLESVTAIDDSNPWLGLASFTEETRGYFYGRDDEVAELARRVQRKLLTVLFGQSGLGKTSILRAGLVPRLRGQGYCPVYVRIDYAKDSPEPAEQIKQAIRANTLLAGQWSHVGVALDGESLWEFLHHRDDVLRDGSGQTLIPLLIFDQFEEIFTLAQSDEFGRARAARFIEDLADLVENRPPRALEAKLDADDSAAERFDFSRSDYRVLIALREDYLAPLEGLKATMPSVSQNRLRLAPMTGTQALAAVLEPGRRLVTQEVAEAIVRFVAGGAEIANAEIEPSLLSLICRELNDARLAAGRKEISLDLLAGSHATILSTFYERSLADQPLAIRRIIEEELLTSSGYRENVAEERLVSRFAQAGAPAETLAVLVNRRLLRVEERLDIRRVELTHDVLCSVVRTSRDQRHEREAREATERLLAEQRQREQASRRALLRARQIATGCIALAVVAIVAAGLALLSVQRARRAERVAQQTQAASDQARIQAERLLGYLSDDFVRELESFGGLNVVAEFSKRQIDYFHGLPRDLVGPETIRSGALALIHHARALRLLGDPNKALDEANEAIQLLEQRTAAGDHTESNAIALTQAYLVKAVVLDNQSDPTGPVVTARAIALLKPLAEAPQASATVRRYYGELLVRQGFEESSANQFAQAIAILQRARQIFTELGALTISNPEVAADYAETGAWLSGDLAYSGRNEDAKRLGEADLQLVAKILTQRPGNRTALHAEQILLSNVAAADVNMLDPVASLKDGVRMLEVSDIMLGMDPNNVTTLNNSGVAEQLVAGAYWSSGQLRESMPHYVRSLDYAELASRGGAGMNISRAANMAVIAQQQAVLGDFKAAIATAATNGPFLATLQQDQARDHFPSMFVAVAGRFPAGVIAEQQDDPELASRIGLELESQLGAFKPNGDLEVQQTSITRYWVEHLAGKAAYRMGRYADAEKLERQAIASRRIWGTNATSDLRDLGELSTWLALSAARQGRRADADALIRPVVKFQKDLAARNHGDRWLPLELAWALYAQSLAEPSQAAALRAQAAQLLSGLAAQIAGLHDTRQLRGWLNAERRSE